jgi:endonuclease/exonuclease/phosphatase family metal-dependent hydrolase
MAVVLSWNVAGRVRSVSEQAAALAECPADIVALQEIRATAAAAWEDELRALGFEHVAVTLPAGGAQRPPERRLGVLVASRSPLELGPELGIPWPERHLAVLTDIDGVTTEIHNLHAPISSKAELAKVLTLEAVYEYLLTPSETPRVLVGDLNTPQYESREGEVRSFARTRGGAIRPAYGERHDQAELALIVGLLKAGYRDAFREIHGYARRDRSWLYPNGKMGYRLDHVIARGLRLVACEYEHSWREQRLSDHSAIWAQLTASTAP